MKQEYQNWIDEHIKDPQLDAYGKCVEVTQEMVKVFPELKRVRGHYYCVAWGERGHWWLVTPDGEVIDPTASQFPSKGKGHYEPWIEGSPEPTGMCPNCGDLIYDGNYCCSESCHRAYALYCSL